MNDALDPQLARIALKKIANHKSTALEPQLLFAQLVEKIHQEFITRTHIDRHKLSTNSTFSSSINNLSIDIDHLTIDDIHMMEQDIAKGINVIYHNYSSDLNYKGKSLFLKFSKKNAHKRDTAFPPVLTKDTQNHLKNLNFKNKHLIKRWKVIKTFQTNKSHQTI